MVCTKCEWDEKVRAGEFKNAAWGDTPCARCQLREDSTGTVAYEDDRPPQEEGCGGGAPDGEDPLLPTSVLADALRLFLALPRDALDVLHLRYGGMPYREIAAKLGVGTAAVEVRHKRMIENIPALRELFPGKARKRQARRRERG
jgi:DNA-directed RNA polymerase specialized sigma24 family protein